VSEWANVTDSTSGMKLHVIHDPDSDRPVYAAFSAANVNDITMAQQMPVEPGATYVFDLGYYDFGWWAKLDRAGCRIVTRFKSNTPLSVVKELPIPQASAVLSDRIGHLPQRQARSRTNPFLDPVREVRIKTETGKVLRILCNDLDADAEEIAALYKRRWAVELFFRWVKQTLRITRFFGTSENAVRIQIIVALIAYLLLRMAHAAQRSVQSPLDFARLVRLNLMHRRSINALLEPHQPMTRLANQLALAFHA
jgi:IS4 transposase